ncbi:MAG: hypothetical protein HFJ93_02900 [Muribaculaceae bacterium]|nr:hypothetical protein [Muribaculaceae bacterium]
MTASSHLRLLTLILAMLPLAAAAQSNIKAAFDAIIKSPEATVTERHTLDRDPATGRKSGQCDIYAFTLPCNKANLVDKVFAAFDKDSGLAFSSECGSAADADGSVVLAVGDGSGPGIKVDEKDTRYISALFLPSVDEDPDGHHRYAYAFNCKEADGEITGKLIVTYAYTLKYRQELEQMENQAGIEMGMNVLRSLVNFGASIDIPSQPDSQSTGKNSWFETLMSYLQGMEAANSTSRIALATKAYRLITDDESYAGASESDKDTARELLKVMIADKKYSDSMLNKLLNQCLVNIK